MALCGAVTKAHTTHLAMSGGYYLHREMGAASRRLSYYNAPTIVDDDRVGSVAVKEWWLGLGLGGEA
jgi:hypothetical protein